MFHSVRIKNFRSIRDTGPLELADVNVLVGPNNSGKSSILYALMLLKMTLAEKDTSSALVTCSPELDLGSYLDIIRSGVNDNLSIDFDLDKHTANKYQLFEKRKGTKEQPNYTGCQVEFNYDFESNKVKVKSFSGRNMLGNNILSVKMNAENKWTIQGLPQRLRANTDIHFSTFIPIVTPAGPRPKDEIARQVMDWYYNTRNMYRNLTKAFDDLKYIAPIRERISRYGIMGTMPYSELGPSGQNLMRVLSDSRSIGFGSRSVSKELSYWLGTKFKLLRNIHVENVDTAGTIKTIMGDDRTGIKHVNLASMGFGISQLVPVIIHTVLLPESGCLLVEQPEIHLHPSAQADLADLFIANTKYNRQFIIETHSEHFILRLRRRIAEGRIKTERVKVFFIEKVRGVTRINQPLLKSNGNFVEWPKGFFEDGYKEALAIAKASYKPE